MCCNYLSMFHAESHTCSRIIADAITRSQPSFRAWLRIVHCYIVKVLTIPEAINLATLLFRILLSTLRFRMSPQLDSVASVQPAPKRTRIDYLEEVGLDRAKAVVEKKRALCSTTNWKGSWLFTGSKNTDGYGQIYLKPASRSHLKGRKAQKAFLLHVLSFVGHNNMQPLGLHTSHLCHQKSCFNPDHLISESASANNCRKDCLSLFGPISKAYSCRHEPKCL